MHSLSTSSRHSQWIFNQLQFKQVIPSLVLLGPGEAWVVLTMPSIGWNICLLFRLHTVASHEHTKYVIQDPCVAMTAQQMPLPVKSDLITEQFLLGLLNPDSPCRHSLHVVGTTALFSQWFGDLFKQESCPHAGRKGPLPSSSLHFAQ